MELEKVRRVIKQLATQSGSRISRAAMPNGFLLNDLIWYGDGLSDQTAIARGFFIEPIELESMDIPHMEWLSMRLRALIESLGEEYCLMVKYIVGNDYSDVLKRYRGRTDAIEDQFRYRWTIYSRNERHERLLEAMEKGELRRETLAIFITKTIDSQPDFSVSESSLAGHFEELSKNQAREYEQVHLDVLTSRFPECRIKMMSDQEHYEYYYRFLNPSLGSKKPDPRWLDDSVSVLENCLPCDFYHPPRAGISFQLDGFNHVMLVMRELPKQVGEGVINKLLTLGFNNFEINVNIYPQRSEEVIRKIGKIKSEIVGEAKNDHVMRDMLADEAEMGKEKIYDLSRGHFNPVKMLFTMRIWDRDADKVISNASIARNRFRDMSGSLVHHATMTETSAQLFYNTFPGWTYSTYREWDLLTDDGVAADLLPWSASFTGRLKEGQALYQSPRGSLVGLALFIGKTGQHVLVFGITGAGKSILLTDLISQTLPDFGYVLLIEEGLSHGTTAQTAGTEPIIISPSSGITINYLDVDGLPLGNDHIAFAVTLCCQMLRENQNPDKSRLSEVQAVLSQHLNSLYDDAWEEWSQAHPEETRQIETDAYYIEQHREKMKPGSTFMDAWIEFRRIKDKRDEFLQRAETVCPELPKYWDGDIDVAKFSVDPATKRIVRNLGLSMMKPSDMPTHAELVENMIHTPETPDAQKLGERLSAWNAGGIYGKIFDGQTNTRLDGALTHIELSQIPEAMPELREIAHFLMMNVAMQQVMKRPRGEKKLVVFEEGSRIIAMEGGANALKRYYTGARKFGACVVTILQQASSLSTADPELKAAVVGNTKLFLVSAQPDEAAAAEIAQMLGLSPAEERELKSYATPENQIKKFGSFLMVIPDSRHKIVGTLRNYASPAVIYCGASDTDVFDKRTEALKKYDDIVEGILIESAK